MRIVFPCLAALVLASAPAMQAQQAAAADAPPVLVAQNQRRPVPVATPIPQEEPKKKGMLQRLFGGREKATPAPRQAATPEKATPTPRPQRRTTNNSRRAKAEEEDEKPAPAKVEKKEDAPAVAKKTTKPKPKAKDDEEETNEGEEAAPEEKLTAEQQAVKDAEAGGNPIAIEKAKYDEVKSRAVQDEKIVALKEKADSATDEEEGRKALRAYNKALFQKMRTLDSSIRERVDLMEEAVMRRLEPTTTARN
jgi:hypothetical protein